MKRTKSLTDSALRGCFACASLMNFPSSCKESHTERISRLLLQGRREKVHTLRQMGPHRWALLKLGRERTQASQNRACSTSYSRAQS